MRGLVVAAAALLIVTTGIVGAPSARADDYPTWDDVAAVRGDEAATQQKIAEIEGLVSGLQSAATIAQQESDAKAAVWVDADTRFQEAYSRTQKLIAQADEASTVAAESGRRAGQIAAKMGRAGGGDITLMLFSDSTNADSLLYALGAWAKVGEQASRISDKAIQDRNTAQALTDQAEVAQDQLEQLKAEAESAFLSAQSAAAAAQAALDAQLANQATLQQQLAVLTERRTATEADYLAGVEARTGSGASLDAGEISLAGWARPASGYINSVYGWSAQYGSSFHKGVDLGAGCNQNIYAGSSGTVVYAAGGWNGGYGNYIIIDHGNGVQTAYAHIIEGGILVSAGQQIVVGQNIARAGTTGNSTGCHLHYEVRLDGVTTDPVQYMADRGIQVG